MKTLCNNHNQVFTQYCKQCKQALCPQCSKHQNHSMLSLVHILIPEELNADINQLIAMREQITNTLDNILQIKGSLQNYFESEKEAVKSGSELRDVEDMKEKVLRRVSDLSYEYKELRLSISKRKKAYTIIQAQIKTATNFANLYSGYEQYSEEVLPIFIEESKKTLDKLGKELKAISSINQQPLCSDGRIGRAKLDCGHYLCSNCICRQRSYNNEIYCTKCPCIQKNISKLPITP